MKSRNNHRFWRQLFKRNLKRVTHHLFRKQINEKLLEENKQKYLELRMQSGFGPYL